MMTKRTLSHPLRLLVVTVGCAGAALAAHADGEPTAMSKTTRTAKADTRAVKAAWVAAPAGKHNGSGVRVAFRVPANLQPGQAATVDLQFTGVTSDDARAEWRAADGAATVASTGGSSAALQRGQVTTVSVSVTPAADGMAYLDVFTSQGGRTTAQSVPLKVGSGRVLLKPSGTAETTPSGEKVISLPSQTN